MICSFLLETRQCPPNADSPEITVAVNGEIFFLLALFLLEIDGPLA